MNRVGNLGALAGAALAMFAAIVASYFLALFALAGKP